MFLWAIAVNVLFNVFLWAIAVNVLFNVFLWAIAVNVTFVVWEETKEQRDMNTYSSIRRRTLKHTIQNEREATL